MYCLWAKSSLQSCSIQLAGPPEVGKHGEGLTTEFGPLGSMDLTLSNRKEGLACLRPLGLLLLGPTVRINIGTVISQDCQKYGP